MTSPFLRRRTPAPIGNGGRVGATVCVSVVLIVSALAACSGDSPTGVLPPPPSVSLSIEAADSTLAVGQTVKAVAFIVANPTDSVSSGVSWTSSNSAVASVSSSGVVSAASPGSATLTASFGGTNATLPIAVTAANLPPAALLSIFASGDYSCGQAASGNYYCWGGTTQFPIVAPQHMPTSGFTILNMVGTAPVGMGGVEADGTVIAGGPRLGNASPAADWFSHSVFAAGNPGSGPGGARIVSIVPGEGSVCGLTGTGAAYCTGLNNRGQLGDGVRGPQGGSPWTAVSGGLSFKSLASSSEAVCGVTTGGSLYCWGADNAFIVAGDPTDELVPTLRSQSTNFASVSSGLDGMCALDNSGVAICWGGGNAMGLLSGTMQPMFGGQSLAKLSVSETHVCGLTSNGTALCAGTNSGGELGLGTSKPLPATYYTVASPVAFSSISAGYGHSCALGTDGHSYCWGQNASGEVGDGTTHPRAGAVMVMGATP